jgi:hypothetical protein
MALRQRLVWHAYLVGLLLLQLFKDLLRLGLGSERHVGDVQQWRQ